MITEIWDASGKRKYMYSQFFAMSQVILDDVRYFQSSLVKGLGYKDISGVTINRDYDHSVRFTILCFHVLILVWCLHTFSRVSLASYYIVKSESRTL